MTTAIMLYAFALGGLFVVAAMLLDHAAVLRHAPRRLIWMAALAATLVLTMATPWRVAIAAASESPGAAGAGALPADGLSWGVVVSSMRDGLSAAASRAAAADPVLTLAWATMSVVSGGLYLAGYVTLARRRRGWHRRDVLGYDVLLSSDTGPAVVGVGRAAIVLPAWVLALDREAISMIVRHEQEHLRARDHWLVHAVAAAVVVMPWNPWVWVMASRLRLALECDCDARVLASGRDGVDRIGSYADVLLVVGTHGHGRRSWPAGAPAMLEPSSTLSKRIAAMYPTAVRLAGVRAAMAALAATVIVAAACGTPPPTASAEVGNAVATAPDTVVSFESPGVRRPGGGVTNPRVVHEARPQYTPEALRNTVAGTVELEVLVRADGSVGDVRVTKSLDPEFGLDEEAVKAARLWRFEPATADGRPVPIVVTLVLSFRTD